MQITRIAMKKGKYFLYPRNDSIMVSEISYILVPIKIFLRICWVCFDFDMSQVRWQNGPNEWMKDRCILRKLFREVFMHGFIFLKNFCNNAKLTSTKIRIKTVTYDLFRKSDFIWFMVWQTTFSKRCNVRVWIRLMNYH